MSCRARSYPSLTTDSYISPRDLARALKRANSAIAPCPHCRGAGAARDLGGGCPHSGALPRHRAGRGPTIADACEKSTSQLFAWKRNSQLFAWKTQFATFRVGNATRKGASTRPGAPIRNSQRAHSPCARFQPRALATACAHAWAHARDHAHRRHTDTERPRTRAHAPTRERASAHAPA